MKNLVIVIGGSSGIGYAIASALLLSGKHEVLNLSRHTASMIKCLKMDATDYRQVERAFWKVKNNYGTPKHMVYCAGVANPQGVLEIDRETWRKTIDTNLTGAFYCTQEFVKIAKKSGGSIIYIASTAGTRPQPGWSSYAAAKAGLINFAITMNEELKEYGIKCYCLAPGRCNTQLRAILAPNEDRTKIMQPEEVAQFVKYIIENDNVLNGQIIKIKGNTYSA